MKLGRTARVARFGSARPPRWVRTVNALGGARRGGRFELTELLDAASRRTGLGHFGEADFVSALEQLIRSVDEEAELHTVGRTLFGARLRALLENRLRIEACFARHPEIERIAIRRPIVIAGLQRTGTTLLHRLIAADPRARALRGWEALAPAPLPGEGRRGSVRRRALGRAAEWTLATLAPDFFAIHPVESEAPEEDVLLLDHAFASQSPEAMLHVPSYAAWLEATDVRYSYRYLRRVLQLLTWQSPRAFWVLKTPHHVEYLSELLEVFPDAVVVQTHRDPQVTIPSFCSMVAHGRAVFSERVDPLEIGRHWSRKVGRMVERARLTRQAHPSASFVDVAYAELVTHPLAVVGRIYAALGVPLGEAARGEMCRTLAVQRQHRYGRHVYFARDFGLNEEGIEAAFGDYRERFGIPREAGSRAPSTGRT